MVNLMRAWMTSRWNYQLAYFFDFVTPIVVFLLALRGALPWPVSVASVTAGILVFTFVEYAMHRWYFHGSTAFADGLHSGHHRHPRAPTAIPCLSSPAAPLLFRWPLSHLIGDTQAWFFLSGLLGCYFYYSLLHHLQHRVRPHALPLTLLRQMWAGHGIHHARANVNYGVTTTLWDRIFRTYQSPGAARSLARVSAR
jgi:sterol desaturase/sphingolipid hydroxylase (fatty acid hydroxylase superfamily)